METTKLSTKCLSCGQDHDLATCMTSDDKPSPGDFTICWNCGHLMAFDDNLKLRELNDKEMWEIAGHEIILKMQKARAEVRKGSLQ